MHPATALRPRIAPAAGSAPAAPPGARSAAAEAADFPAGGVPNAEALVSVHWLRQLLAWQASGARAPRPRGFTAARFVVLEVSWGQAATRDRPGHLPGAVHLDTDALETPGPQWRLHALPVLQRAIGASGIDADTTVIVYSRELIAAARGWWVLKYAGVRDVRLLDGGFTAWAGAGYPVERALARPRRAVLVAPRAGQWLASTGYVRAHRGAALLADVRSHEEYAGLASGYGYIEARGRLPGAVHAGDGDDEAALYCTGDGRLRPPAAILALWRECGLPVATDGADFEREVVFYCGTGWRSSLACFYAWLLGFTRVRNYSDGWSGWSTRYVPDSLARGVTPGWRQLGTGNPVEASAAGVVLLPRRVRGMSARREFAGCR